MSTHVPRNVFEDIRLQWHIHIHCTNDEAQLPLLNIQDTWYKDGVPYNCGWDAISSREWTDAPATSLHLLFARCSTWCLSARSLTKYMFEYWCL